jgi:hypothetical protein
LQFAQLDYWCVGGWVVEFFLKWVSKLSSNCDASQIFYTHWHRSSRLLLAQQIIGVGTLQNGTTTSWNLGHQSRSDTLPHLRRSDFSAFFMELNLWSKWNKIWLAEFWSFQWTRIFLNRERIWFFKQFTSFEIKWHFL